jgi:hypothetical protein
MSNVSEGVTSSDNEQVTPSLKKKKCQRNTLLHSNYGAKLLIADAEKSKRLKIRSAFEKGERKLPFFGCGGER